MKYFFIVLNKNANIIDWSRFHNPEVQRLILITGMGGAGTLSENKALFYRIFEMEAHSTKKLLQIICDFIKNEKIPSPVSDQMFIATSDELGLLPCAEVREFFGLQGNTVAEILPFRDKILMKSKMIHLKHFLPNYLQYAPQEFSHHPVKYMAFLENALGYPMFAKPLREGGSRGISTLYHRKHLLNWCTSVGDDSFELDQFISGTLFHCDSIIQNNKILFTCVGKYAYPCALFFSGKPAASMLLLDTDQDYKALTKANECILSALTPIPDGCTHLEIFKTETGHFKFLEVAARSPGGLIPDVYRTWLGVDFREAQLKLQLGLAYDIQVRSGPYGAWFWYPNKPGIITQYRHMPKGIKSQYQLKWDYNPGDHLPPPKRLRDYTCTLILSNMNYKQLSEDFDLLKDHSMYDVNLSSF